MELDYKTGSAPASRQLRARASMSYPKMLLHFIQVALFSPIALYQAVVQPSVIVTHDISVRRYGVIGVIDFQFHTRQTTTATAERASRRGRGAVVGTRAAVRESPI